MATADHKRIAKNTVYLYFRMGIVMLVQLYTSRVVLHELGDANYGIWNVVGTLIVAISFITSPLSAATQRFLNIELGKENEAGARKVFNTSLMLYGIIAMMLVVLIETGGLWYLNHKMVLPAGSRGAADVVFQLSALSFVVNILRIPYDATIVAYERFNFYALIGIVEVVLRLVIVWILQLLPDEYILQWYALMSVGVTVVVTAIYVIYCNVKTPVVRLERKYDKSMVKELLTFSGWSTFGAFAVMMSSQGLNLVINVFFGVVVNAAMGIAGQVSVAINYFVSNFQRAFQPQIIKTYSGGTAPELYRLSAFASKVSLILILLIGVPLSFNIRYVLSLWLGHYPPDTPVFIILFVAAIGIEAVGAPLWMMVYAVGKIKVYESVSSGLMITTIGVAWVLYRMGMPASSGLVARMIIYLAGLLFRIAIVHKMIGFDLSKMLGLYLLRPALLTLLSMLPFYVLGYVMPADTFQYLLTSTGVFIMVFMPAVLFIDFDKSERRALMNKIPFLKSISAGRS